jgi:hypothetical protein
MEPTGTDISPIQHLFQKAQEEGGLEYVFTLVRVDGMKCYEGYRDEMEVLRDWVKQPDTSDLLSAYRFLASYPEPLELLQNLIFCANGKPFHVSAFSYLNQGKFPHVVRPTIQQVIQAVIDSSRASGLVDLGDVIGTCYVGRLLDPDIVVDHQGQELRAAFDNLLRFIQQLLDCYFAELLTFLMQPKYHKLPRFEVLELITEPAIGLSGFRLHFPEGCTATFLRSALGVIAENLRFGPPLSFLVSSTQPSKQEWRVNGKRLFEVGLPGKYNVLGEWKPLIYPAKADHLIQECLKLSDDPDVQGVLLYMRLTGHCCIEFALRTDMELPGTYSSTKDGSLHIWRCPTQEYDSARNMRVYDCWLQLETGSVEDIEQGLANIGRFVSILCFPFGASYSWRNKYRMTHGEHGCLTPTNADVKIVDDTLQKFPNTPDGVILEAGIDWYNRGSTSNNIFTRFLCYYVALESVAVALAEGADLGGTLLTKPNKTDRRSIAKACVKAKHAELFSADPVDFVNQAYFDCVQSLKSRTKSAASAIFGENHPYLKLLFEASSDGDISLSKIRGELAHGGVTLLHKKHERLVRKHVHEIERISKEFLLRVLFHLKPDDAVPSWSGTLQLSLNTADPRSSLYSTRDDIFPKPTDWRIRAEWCE